MRDWRLKSGDPLSLTLAADARLGPTDYLNDQIWELSLRGGSPPALAVQTTFGLRARSYRIFPIFREGETELSDAESFVSGAVLQRIFPNFCALSYSPFPDIDVVAEYWVPDSHTLTSRSKLTNHSKSLRKIRLDWVCQLSPTEGQRMSAAEMQAASILKGQTSDLALVFFLTGGPHVGSGAYASLALDLELKPGETFELVWAQAALANTDEAFVLARKLAGQNWEAMRQRIEMLNTGLVEIYTGDPAWDAAFMLTQKTALGLIVTSAVQTTVTNNGETQSLPFASLVQSRQPDQGYSLRKDGSDYNHLWNGQSPLEVYYLIDMLLPNTPELAEGLLRNYLAIQASDGFIDWKPGLGGQRSRVNATPILASLAWRIYQSNERIEFLKDIYPSLVKFVLSWFNPRHDRDGDGIPEWDNVLQFGFEDHPIYSHWHEWSLGLDITTAESPALCAALYRECQTLLKIAKLISNDEHVATLNFLTMRLKVTVEAAWDSQENAYSHWDRDTHLSARCELVGQISGSGVIEVQKTFQRPARLLFHLQTHQDSRPRPQITVTGTDLAGSPIRQTITEDRIKWYLRYGRSTGDQIYTAIETIETQNLDSTDLLTVYWAGHRFIDYSSLLPLWAGLPGAETAQALIEKTILDEKRFWRAYGLPACANPPDHSDNTACIGVHLPWINLIGEGLVNYGHRQTAAGLIQRVMTGILQSLRNEAAFRRSYHAVSGQGIGERNALGGLAPLGLFLHTLGVRIISPYRVALAGMNPFPWPVTVKYRGLTVLRQKEKTMVIFPDGQTVMIDDPKPQIVSLEVQPVAPGSKR